MSKEFLIGRYYFDTLFREQANKAFIEDIIKEPTFEEGNLGYALASITVDNNNNKEFNFVRGTFAKFKIKDYYKKYSKKDNVLQELINENKVEASIEFFLHHPTHLIFVERSSKIKEDIFKNKFIKIYEKNSSIAGPNMGLDFLFDNKDVYEEIITWEKIIRAKFKDLRPSNPKMEPIFNKIDELLKETKGDRTKLDFKIDDTEKGGSLNPESVLIKQALALSSYGYGNANFYGYKNKAKSQINTEKFTKSLRIDFDSDLPFDVVIEFIRKQEEGEV